MRPDLRKWLMSGLLAVALSGGAGGLAAEDRDAAITHFRSHALAEIASPAGPDEGLAVMAAEVRLLVLQNPLSATDAAEFGTLARGVRTAPPANLALILDVMTQMLKAASRDPQSAAIPAGDHDAALGSALHILAAGEADSRDAALRYLRQTGDRAAIGPAIAALHNGSATTRREAALLLYDHATGPEAARIRKAIARADAGDDAELQRLFTAILSLAQQ